MFHEEATLARLGRSADNECDRAGKQQPAGRLPKPEYTRRGISVKYFLAYFCGRISNIFMAHTLEEKKRLLNRVRRIMGQVAAIERTLDQEGECSDVLHNISACRGAMDALMAEVIEGHIRFHILPTDGSATDVQTSAADDLVAALRAYLK
jgi:DNA-binding FrmR family transcriptional regulator